MRISFYFLCCLQPVGVISFFGIQLPDSTSCDTHYVSYLLDFTPPDIQDKFTSHGQWNVRTIHSKPSSSVSLNFNPNINHRTTCRHNILLSFKCFDAPNLAHLLPFKENSIFLVIIPQHVDCSKSNYKGIAFMSSSYFILRLDRTRSFIQEMFSLCPTCLASGVFPPLRKHPFQPPNNIFAARNELDWDGAAVDVLGKRYPGLSTSDMAKFCSFHARMDASRKEPRSFSCKPAAVVSIMEILGGSMNATLSYSSSEGNLLDDRVIGMALLDDPLELGSGAHNIPTFIKYVEILYRGDVYTSLVYCVPKVGRMDLDLWFWVRPFALDPTLLILLMVISLLLDLCAKGQVYCGNYLHRERLFTTSGLRIYGSLLLMLVCAIYECKLSSDVTIPSPPIRIKTFRELVVDKKYRIQGVPTNAETHIVYRLMLETFSSENLSKLALDSSLLDFSHSTQMERRELLSGCNAAIFTTDDDIVFDSSSHAFYELDSHPEIKCNRLRNLRKTLKFKYTFLKAGNHRLRQLTSRLVASGTVSMLYNYENHVSLLSNRKNIASSMAQLDIPMPFNISHWRVTPTFVLWASLILASGITAIVEIFIQRALWESVLEKPKRNRVEEFEKKDPIPTLTARCHIMIVTLCISTTRTRSRIVEAPL